MVLKIFVSTCCVTTASWFASRAGNQFPKPVALLYPDSSWNHSPVSVLLGNSLERPRCIFSSGVRTSLSWCWGDFSLTALFTCEMQNTGASFPKVAERLLCLAPSWQKGKSGWKTMTWKPGAFHRWFAPSSSDKLSQISATRLNPAVRQKWTRKESLYTECFLRILSGVKRKAIR